MYDPSSVATATYRTSEVSTSGPVAQVVLLYQGAIRFGVQHIAALERGDLEAAHRTSLRCQQIVAALRETLDPAAGPIAGQLDQLYEFILRHLVEGNVRKLAQPTNDAVELLRALLPAWQEIARQQGGGPVGVAPAFTHAPAGAGPLPSTPVLVIGAGR